MKLTEKQTHKNLITVITSIVVCVILAAGVTFAAYTSQGHMRGVARNRDGESIRFASNYLKNCTTSAEKQGDYTGKVILYDDASKNESEILIDIYIYNYVAGNMKLVNENDITYDMTIRLSGGSKSDYTVRLEDTLLEKKAEEQELTYGTPEEGVTLSGRVAHTHHYTVTIAGEDLNKIRITAIAKPRKMTATNNQLLAAVIMPCTESTVQKFTCKGSFADEGVGSPKDYDAFNYEVVISSGRANVTISWKPDKVEIDPFFLQKLANREKDNTYKYNKEAGTLSFIMDYSAGAGDYMIPFYLTSEQKKLPTTWTDMKEYISVEGQEIEATLSNSLEE